MNVLERYIAENLTMSCPSGKVVQVSSGSHCVFELPNFTPDIAEGLWVRLVLCLTERKLVNGILDMPIAQQRDHAIVWAKDFKILCRAAGANQDPSFLKKPRPSLPPAITLAIGGPTGVGKTTLIRHLLASSVGKRVRRYVAYTTRPPRSNEMDEVDYHFVEPADMPSYQSDPRFTGFVEARGYWYWTEPSNFFKVRWSAPRVIHVFSITQVHEFLTRRDIAPDLQWIWLDASPETLRQRFEKRGDQNVAQSLAQNVRLKGQDRTGLVSLHINTEVESIEASLQKLLDFIKEAQEEKP